MSAARPAASAALRRPPPAPVIQPAARAPARAFFTESPSEDHHDELRLNLRDLPAPAAQSLDVEGFKPSLLSRLFDLIVPLHNR